MRVFRRSYHSESAVEVLDLSFELLGMSSSRVTLPAHLCQLDRQTIGFP